MEVQTLVSYYAREGLFKHVQQVCVDALKKRGDDAALLFWKAVGLLLEQNGSSSAEAMRDLQAIQEKRDVKLAVLAAISFAHSKAKLVDSEAVDELQKNFSGEISRSSRDALLIASEFFLLTKQQEKAAECAKKAQEKQDSADVRALQGWIELLLGSKETAASKAAKQFDTALKLSAPKYFADALLGQARCSCALRKFSEAIEMLNQAAVLHPWLAVHAFSEKARVLLASGEWDQALEAAGKALAKDAQCVSALEISVVYSLTREGASTMAVSKTADLSKALEGTEPKNSQLLCREARIIGSVAGKNSQVVQIARSLCDKALSACPDDSSILAEYGRMALLAGDAPAALAHFRKAIQKDEGNVRALHGILRALLYSGSISEAEQQLDFLAELQAATGKTSELGFLSAFVKSSRGGSTQEVISPLLTEAVDTHFKSLRGVPLGPEYFVSFDADTLIEAARLYLSFCGDEPMDKAAPVPESLSRARKLLEVVSKALPGHLECIFQLSRCRMIGGEIDRALSAAGQCIKLNSSFSDAYLLVAQLHLSSSQPKQALQALENAVSHNFRVRQNAQYFLLRAKSHTALGDHESAWKALDQAFELPAVKAALEPGKQASATPAATISGSSYESMPSNWVIASLQIERAQSLVAQGRQQEGRELLQDCARGVRGTPLEVRVIIAQAQMLAAAGDAQSALRSLSLIEVSHASGPSAYIRAQAAAAAIYLSIGDRRSHVRCYEKLAEAIPTLQTQLMLAEAFSRIQEPETAVGVYKSAMEKASTAPERLAIARRVGQALLATHEYNKAAEHLEQAHKADPADLTLSFDLADLYARMKRIADAERIANSAAERLTATTTAGSTGNTAGASREQATAADYSALAKLHLLLARTSGEIYTKGFPQQPQKIPEHLMKAREFQLAAVSRAKTEAPDMLPSAKQAAADIAFKLAEFYAKPGVESQQRAQAFYAETLQYDDQHLRAMLALALLHLSRGENDLCQHQCSAALRADPTCEEASMMLADLMMQKGDHEEAVFHYQQLLQRRPDNFHALERLVWLLRAAGKLDQASKFISAAERGCNGSLPPGLQVCKGLCARLIGGGSGAREALECFNAARTDPEWGGKAREHMIRIYLGEDTEPYMGGGGGVELDEEEEPTKGGSADASKDRGGVSESTQNVNSAKELLRELIGGAGKAEKLEHKIIEAYTLIVTRKKADVEPAIASLMQMCAGDNPDPSALLALSVAHLALKQVPKARNHLRRLVKLDWHASRADDFERGWLLLSRVYIQGSKYDLAQELLKQCLQRNKSCARAWELMGYIAEKESSYRDAAEDYEIAWKLLGETDATIGYKLAFNYLKGKRYVEAITVAHKVLKINPAYPKIKKDIMDKARNSLRP